METGLTTYLLRSSCRKSNSLHLRTKLISVNQAVDLFHEVDYPTCTVLRCGLFLSLPTSTEVLDPVLLGILNQEALCDLEPNAEQSVRWISDAPQNILGQSQASPTPEQQGDQYLGKRANIDWQESDKQFSEKTLRHSVSIRKHGIWKNLPKSALFDNLADLYFQSFGNSRALGVFRSWKLPELNRPLIDFSDGLEQDQPTSSSFNRSSLDDPTHIFLTFMNSLSKTYNPRVPPSSDADAHESKPHSLRTLVKSGKGLSPLLTIGYILANQQKTLLNFQLSGPPKRTNDRLKYNSSICDAFDQLSRLVSAVLDVFIEPYEAALNTQTQQSLSKPKTSNEHIDFDKLQRTKQILLRLRDSASLPLDRFTPDLQGLDDTILFDPHALEVLAESFLSRGFRENYFRRLEAKLAQYPDWAKNVPFACLALSKDVQDPSPGSILAFHKQFLIPAPEKISDLFLSCFGIVNTCVVRNTKLSPRRFFSPIRDTTMDWELVAIWAAQDTKICILSKKQEKLESYWVVDDEKKPSGAPIYLKIFRDNTEIATFEIEPTEAFRSANLGSEVLQYASGRYFVRSLKDSHHGVNQIAILGFSPCLSAVPKPPLLHKVDEERIGVQGSGYVHLAKAFTDKFFSSVTAIPVLQTGGNRTITPMQLGLVFYEKPPNSTQVRLISCGPQFERATRHNSIGRDYSSGTCHTCWSSNSTQLFFIRWIYEADSQGMQTLFVACFELSSGADSLHLITSTYFGLKRLMCPELLQRTEPLVRMLRTQARDFVVLDLLETLPWEFMSDNGSKNIVARILITLHKGKLHWVPVNRKLVYYIPPHIGQQLGYPGYTTKHFSLFHKRRLFNSDEGSCEFTFAAAVAGPKRVQSTFRQGVGATIFDSPDTLGRYQFGLLKQGSPPLKRALLPVEQAVHCYLLNSNI